jgi:hypothetical protein
MSDEDDVAATWENISNIHETAAFNPPKPDVAKAHMAFLDSAIKLLQPIDLFSDRKILTLGSTCKAQYLRTR